MEQMFFPVTRREAERQGVEFSSKVNKNTPFPTRLRELRAEKGVSQGELSRVLGVSKSTVGLWETGDTLPDARYVRALAEYFGVTADFILGLSLATRGEFHTFAERTHYNVSALDKLILAAGSSRNDVVDKRQRRPFEFLICSSEFWTIVDLFRDYLDVKAHIMKECAKDEEYQSQYISLDSAVDKMSNGNFHVISSELFAQALTARAQQELCKLFESARELSDKNGGWEQYMP